MWQLILAIYITSYCTEELFSKYRIYSRTLYTPRKNFVRYLVEYPTLSFLILSTCVTIPMSLIPNDINVYTPNIKFDMHIFWVIWLINIGEELLFRGLFIEKLGRTVNTYIFVSVMYGILWGLISNGVIPIGVTFSLLGFTYSLATEKYGILELAFYKTLLYSAALIM